MWRQTKRGKEKRTEETLTAVRLIRFVFAVWISITFPGQSHTLPIGTAKLPSSAVCPAVRQVWDPVPAAALWPLI